MPTVTAVECIQEVALTLKDQGISRRFEDETLLMFLNNAQFAIVSRRPDANAIIAPFTCKGGVRQKLPADSIMLLDIPCSTGGAAIERQPVKELNEMYRGWRSMTASTDTRCFCYNERYPDYFELFPPAVNGHQIDVARSVSPRKITINNFDTDVTVIGLDDSYKNAITAHMRFQAYKVDSEISNHANLASMEHQLFLSELGQKTEADSAASPNND